MKFRMVGIIFSFLLSLNVSAQINTIDSYVIQDSMMICMGYKAMISEKKNTLFETGTQAVEVFKENLQHFYKIQNSCMSAAQQKFWQDSLKNDEQRLVLFERRYEELIFQLELELKEIVKKMLVAATKEIEVEIGASIFIDKNRLSYFQKELDLTASIFNILKNNLGIKAYQSKVNQTVDQLDALKDFTALKKFKIASIVN